MDEFGLSLRDALSLAEDGEEVVISRNGQPVAKLIALSAAPVPPAPRQPGIWSGQVVIADDFDVLPDDLAAAFRGDQP